MNRSRAAVVVGLIGVLGLAEGCKGKQGDPGPPGPQGPPGPSGANVDQELRAYLGQTGQMHTWQVDVWKAVCQLEKYSQVPNAQKQCPSGSPSDKPPPSFPPQ